jgi:hypothetical protein
MIPFEKLDSNPLFNKFGIYILDRFHTFQNMQSYAVDAATDIDSYVCSKTALHDCTVTSRFSKVWLVHFKTNVHNTGRTTLTLLVLWSLDAVYSTALHAYGQIKYDDLQSSTAA